MYTYSIIFFLYNYLVFIVYSGGVTFIQPSRLIDDGVSANPLTLSRSAVFKNAGSCSCDTFTSPAYINSKIACR